MSLDDSVTHWFAAFRAGNREAVRHLWDRYFRRMMGLARIRLRAAHRVMADEEDIALSAFDSFCQGVELGQFPNLQNRDELWQLLVVITIRKAINVAKHERRKKRGGDQVFRSDDQLLEELISHEPSPAVTAAMDDECHRLLDQLDDEQLRRLVVLKLEGHNNSQCAEQLGRTRATVQRMLNLVRQTWQQELAQ
ncbi:MAG: hypothetical protein K1X57_14165 [Gemmataceae bacterium]|nr:hypothetical protein [Gemmataceae bacterium]